MALTTSGKYRVIGFSLRLPITTSSPSRKMMARNPSHLGSYIRPLGIAVAGLANIGLTGGITGRSTCLILPYAAGQAAQG